MLADAYGDASFVAKIMIGLSMPYRGGGDAEQAMMRYLSQRRNIMRGQWRQSRVPRGRHCHLRPITARPRVVKANALFGLLESAAID